MFSIFYQSWVNKFLLSRALTQILPNLFSDSDQAVIVRRSGVGNALLQDLVRVRFYFVKPTGTPPRIDLWGVYCVGSAKSCPRLSIDDEVDTFMY